MKKILILILLVIPLTSCSNRPSKEFIIEASEKIQELYVDINDPQKVIQSHIFVNYMYINEYLFDEDTLLYSRDLFNYYMSLHMGGGYFTGDENIYFKLDTVNPENKASFSYDGHKGKFTIDGDIITYSVSGSEVNETVRYDTVSKELLGNDLVWQDIYDWIASEDLNIENNSIRYIDGNMIVVTIKFSETLFYITDVENKIFYYFKVVRDFDTRVCDIRMFRIDYDDFLYNQGFPVNPGDNDVFIKSKKLPDTLGEWDEFLQEDGNILDREGAGGRFTYLIDPDNRYDELLGVFTTYFGDSTFSTMWSQEEELGPRFDLKETAITLDSTEIESYDFYSLIDPISTPVYYYPEEFKVTIDHDLDSTTKPGVYTVRIEARDSLDNVYSKDVTVTIN